MTSFAILAFSFSFSLSIFSFSFSIVFYFLVLVFVNEFIIISFFDIFVFVNENHTAYLSVSSNRALYKRLITLLLLLLPCRDCANRQPELILPTVPSAVLDLLSGIL